MDEYIKALIDLHRGVGREGPGDLAFSRQILAELPPLPAKPRIFDLGCGSGAATLLLAKHFGMPVAAVDLAQPFLDAMMEQAEARGLADHIHPLAYGGAPYDPENLRGSCANCNSSRANKLRRKPSRQW